MRFVWSVIMLFVVLSALHLSLFLYQVGAPHPDEFWVRDVETAKHQFAKAIDQPKIVILGGSNALFGLDAEQIEQALGIPTVNMAIHGGLPLWYLLADAEQYLDAGDTVILSIEYSEYVRPKAYEAWFVNEILCCKPDLFWQAPLHDKVEMFSAVPLPRLVTGITSRLSVDWHTSQGLAGHLSATEPSGPSAPRTAREDHVYSLNNISAHGDIKRFGVQPVEDIDYGLSRPFYESPTTWQALARFKEFCSRRKISVLGFWPPVKRNPTLHVEDAAVQHFASDLRNQLAALGIEMMGTLQEEAYEARLFSDHVSHLNADGRRERTEHLIAHMRARRAPHTINAHEGSKQDS